MEFIIKFDFSYNNKHFVLKDILNLDIKDSHTDYLLWDIAGIKKDYLTNYNTPFVVYKKINILDDIPVHLQSLFLEKFGSKSINVQLVHADFSIFPDLEYALYVSRDQMIFKEANRFIESYKDDLNIFNVDDKLYDTEVVPSQFEVPDFDDLEEPFKTDRDAITVPYTKQDLEYGDMIYPVIDFGQMGIENIHDYLFSLWVQRSFPQELTNVHGLGSSPSKSRKEWMRFSYHDNHAKIEKCDNMESFIKDNYFAVMISPNIKLPRLLFGYPGFDGDKLYIPNAFLKNMPPTTIQTSYSFKLDRDLVKSKKFQRMLIEQTTLYHVYMVKEGENLLPGEYPKKAYLVLRDKYVDNPLDGLLDFDQYIL